MWYDGGKRPTTDEFKKAEEVCLGRQKDDKARDAMNRKLRSGCLVVGSKGEGVIVGVLDTGINPANPSFADVVPVEDGGDGYDHTNPLGAGIYKGVCDPANPKYIADWGCNDKLIGYWDFDVANNNDGNYDDDGHGSHTASTAAGNQVDATAYAAKGTEHESR